MNISEQNVSFTCCNIGGRGMNRRILKSITVSIMLFVLISLSCVCFSGCYRGPFFKKEHLEKHLVPDLPKPTIFAWRYRGSEIEVRMTKGQFDRYVESVYEYLVSCNFARLGTRGELYSGLIGMTYYVNVDVDELSDFYILQEMADHEYDHYIYVFVWANETSESSGNYGEWIPHYLEIYYDDAKGKMNMELCQALNPYIFEE